VGVEAQASARVYRLGMLNPGTEPPASDPVLAEWIWAPLRELGYVEGRNLVIERKYAERNFERLPVMARELVQSRVDAILAIGTGATQAAKTATATIPIVFLSNIDPVAIGLVASLAKPGAISPAC
jgi:putative ABC transport system substrate-binding protein